MASLLTDEDPARAKEVQKKHYHFQHELQVMAKELPSKYQQRFSYDLFSALSSALLDGTVFQIVRSLKEVQQLEERALFNQRTKMLNENRSQKQDLYQKHRDRILVAQSKPHSLDLVKNQCTKEAEAFDQKFEEDLKKRDMKVIHQLDQKVMDQQVMLEKAGVPGFFVTNSAQDIRKQMYLLNFILRLSQEQHTENVMAQVAQQITGR